MNLHMYGNRAFSHIFNFLSQAVNTTRIELTENAKEILPIYQVDIYNRTLTYCVVMELLQYSKIDMEVKSLISCCAHFYGRIRCIEYNIVTPMPVGCR